MANSGSDEEESNDGHLTTNQKQMATSGRYTSIALLCVVMLFYDFLTQSFRIYLSWQVFPFEV